VVDNSLLIGIQADTTDLDRSLSGASSGLSRLSTNVDQLGSRLNAALGGTALQTLNTLTQSLDRLSSMLTRLTGQAGQFGAAMSQAAQTGIVDQYGRPISGGGNGAAAGGGEGGGGSGGGGGGRRGGFLDMASELFPGIGRGMQMAQQNPMVAGALGFGAAASAGLDAISGFRRASVASYQLDRYGESEALAGDPTKAILSNAMPANRVEAAGAGLRRGLLSGGALTAAGGIGLMATGIGFLPGLAMLLGGGASAAMSGAQGYYGNQEEQLAANLARNQRFSESIRFRTQYGQQMGGAEQFYGRQGAVDVASAGAQYGIGAAMDFTGRAAQAGVRSPDVGSQMMLEQRFRGRAMSDFMMRQTGRTMSSDDLEQFARMQQASGITSRDNPFLAEGLSGMGAELAGRSGQRFSTPGQITNYMNERVMPVAEFAQEQGLSNAQTMQAVGAGTSFQQRMSGSQLGAFATTRALAGAGITGPAADLFRMAQSRGADRGRLEQILRRANPNITDEQVNAAVGAAGGVMRGVSAMYDQIGGKGTFAELAAGGDEVSAVGVSAILAGRGPRDISRRKGGGRRMEMGGEGVEGTAVDEAAAVLTTEQERQASMQEQGKAMLESVTKAADYFNKAVVQTAREFAQGLGVELSGVLKEPMTATQLNNLSQESADMTGAGRFGH